MHEAWRITKTRRAEAAFDGEGARLHGGRWTSKGRRAVYASGSLALATLELLVHLETSALLKAYSVFPIHIPEALVTAIDEKSLPPDWRAYPAPTALQEIGNDWIESGRSAALRVLSAIVPSEANYVLNPAHPDFSRILVGKRRPYDPDPRLAE